MNIAPKSRIGQQIRSAHPWAYHSGEWANVTGIVTLKVLGEERECYELKWSNGDTDEWPVNDPSAKYEFNPNTPTTTQEEK